MQTRSQGILRAACASMVLAAGFLASPAAAAVNGQQGVLNNREPVWGPDVFGGYATTHIMVRVSPEQGPQGLDQNGAPAFGIPEVDAVLQRHGLLEIRPAVPFAFGDPDLASQLGLDRWRRVVLPRGTDTPELVRQLQALDVFEVVELAGVGGTADTVPNDPLWSQLWNLHNVGNNPGCQGPGLTDADVDAPEAWDLFRGEPTVTLAVIDSGVWNHVDIAPNVIAGYNSVLNNNNVSDDCNHGTHCSGTAGAIGDNNQGIVGVSWGIQIMPIKVLTGCGGTTDQCANGIIWAADNGADVGTMSLQYYSYSQYFEDSTEYATQRDMLLIAATGNASRQPASWPALFPECKGIGALDNRNNRASFSNYGDGLDISAPGVNVLSLSGTNSYRCLSGTSMATPHVSGLACLIMSYNPDLTNDEVWDIIMSTADDLGAPGFDTTYGAGIINVRAALEAATPIEDCPGDLNNDREVDGADFLLFLDLFFFRDPRADLDDSGRIDGNDFLIFLSAFFEGC